MLPSGNFPSHRTENAEFFNQAGLKQYRTVTRQIRAFQRIVFVLQYLLSFMPICYNKHIKFKSTPFLFLVPVIMEMDI